MEDNKDIIEVLVKLVREILAKGLTQNFMRSCVRIGNVQPLTGGLKSNFVGHIRIDVNSIIKIHTDELKQHKILMEKVNNSSAPVKVFPDILQIAKLNDNTYIMLMEELLKYKSFLLYIYSKRLTKAKLEKITEKALERISLVHNTEILEADGFPENFNPYFDRIKQKIIDVLKIDSELRIMLDKEGFINGESIKPINKLLTKIDGWLKHDLAGNNLCLVHGDCHLENILFRPRSYGFSCVTIDPNPLVGLSDPIYDYGKLLHWVDIVGWAKFKPERCKAVWSKDKTSWKLKYWVDEETQSVTKRRKYANNFINNYLKNISGQLQGDWEKRLNISLASAHLGFASILTQTKHNELRRFVFSRALQLLNKVE